MMVQITTDKSGPKLVCPICNKALMSLNGYVKHMKKHEPPGGFCCNYCEDRFCLEDLLKKHKDEKHKILACRICHTTFSADQEYRAHIKDIHKGVDRPMSVCEKCGVEFKTLQALKRHTDTQCGQIKPHPCDECNMAFYTKYNLAEHKKIHRGEKKFCCSYCGKSFLSNGRLVIHERSHTGEKPYKCDVCGKCFAHRESIVTHSSIHTGVKLVVCKCCGARFSCHSNLIKHRRTRQETCGLPMYDSTKEKKRNGKSRIPPSLMSSEIKIIRASKVINPKEEQRNPRAHRSNNKQKTDTEKKAIEDQIKPNSSRPNKNVREVSDEEDVIIKRPRRNLKPTNVTKLHTDEEIESLPFEESENDWQSDDNFVDPSFESPINDSSDSERFDVKPTKFDRILVETPIKKEENSTQYFKEKQPISELEQKPCELDIPAEKDPALGDFVVAPTVFIKEEPLGDVKEELSDTKNYEYPAIKPCRVILEEASQKYPIAFGLASKELIERKRAIGKRKYQSAFRRKLRIFKKDRIYDCNYCVKVYHIRKPYEKHLYEQHNKTYEEIRSMFIEEDDDIPSDLVHRCPICSKIYLMAKRLKTHITFHGPDGKLIHKCPCYCNIYFQTKEEAVEHAKSAHKESIYCNICDKYAQTPEGLNIHKRTHKGSKRQVGRNLICDKCAKSFASKTALSDHTRSNCGQNPLYHCDTCDKKFTTAGILKTHLLLHKDETPFTCETCGKSFKIKSQYKAHLKHKHTDVKSFKCNLCPKEYPYRESLLTHMAIHTGLKRYACNGCSKRFTCISNLQAHRKVYADTCGLQPLNSKPSQYIGMQKGLLLMGTKPTF